MALKTHGISIPFVDGNPENQDSIKTQQVDADPSSLHHWLVQSDAYGCVRDDCNSIKLDMLEWLSEKIEFPEEVRCCAHRRNSPYVDFLHISSFLSNAIRASNVLLIYAYQSDLLTCIDCKAESEEIRT